MIAFYNAVRATLNPGRHSELQIDKQGILLTNSTGAIDLEGNAQASLAISSAAAQTGALETGIYDVWSDIDCYLKVAATANNVTTSTGYLLRANNTVPISVIKDSKIGAITSGASSTLFYHKVA